MSSLKRTPLFFIHVDRSIKLPTQQTTSSRPCECDVMCTTQPCGWDVRNLFMGSRPTDHDVPLVVCVVTLMTHSCVVLRVKGLDLTHIPVLYSVGLTSTTRSSSPQWPLGPWGGGPLPPRPHRLGAGTTATTGLRGIRCVLFMLMSLCW